MKNSIRFIRRLTLSTAFALAALCSTVALAGEVKIGTKTIEVDDKGKITAAGKSAIVDTLDEVPGEDVWVAHVYAKLDNPAPGPLYIEFYQELDGEKTLVWRHDINNFNGEKWIVEEVELEGRRGFNKNRTYDIKVTQVSPKGKDLTLATGKIKLIKSGKKPEGEKDEGGEEGEEKDKDLADQDAHDSLGGDGNDAGQAGESEGTKEGPPPVETKKKGCSVDSDDSAWNGAAILLLIGAGALVRRRRD